MLDLRTKPELDAPLAEIDRWPWHVRVLPLVLKHGVSVGEAQDVGDALGVYEIVGFNLGRHETHPISVGGEFVRAEPYPTSIRQGAAPAVREHPRGLAETCEEVTTMAAYATQITESGEPVAVAQESRFLTRDEVMTAREVADLLRMPTSTVYDLARKGVLPARRLGRTWRFLRPRLEELLAS